MLRADIESVLVSREQIEQKVTQLGTQRARKPLAMYRFDRTLKWIFQASMCCW